MPYFIELRYKTANFICHSAKISLATLSLLRASAIHSIVASARGRRGPLTAKRRSNPSAPLSQPRIKHPHVTFRHERRGIRLPSRDRCPIFWKPSRLSLSVTKFGRALEESRSSGKLSAVSYRSVSKVVLPSSFLSLLWLSL